MPTSNTRVIEIIKNAKLSSMAFHRFEQGRHGVARSRLFREKAARIHPIIRGHTNKSLGLRFTGLSASLDAFVFANVQPMDRLLLGSRVQQHRMQRDRPFGHAINMLPHIPSDPMATELSEGRTLLTRNHRNTGVKVHVADRTGSFLTLYVAPAASLDDNVDDAVFVLGGPTTFQVSIGHDATQLAVRMDEVHEVKCLATRIFVRPHEEVYVSCSCPRHFLVYGVAQPTP